MLKSIHNVCWLLQGSYEKYCSHSPRPESHHQGQDQVRFLQNIQIYSGIMSRKSYHMRRCLRPKQRTSIGFTFSDPLLKSYAIKLVFEYSVFFSEVCVHIYFWCAQLSNSLPGTAVYVAQLHAILVSVSKHFGQQLTNS